MIKWTIEDYKDLYHERAGIIMNDGISKYSANCRAFNEVFKKFKKDGARCDEELAEFRKKVK